MDNLKRVELEDQRDAYALIMKLQVDVDIYELSKIQSEEIPEAFRNLEAANDDNFTQIQEATKPSITQPIQQIKYRTITLIPPITKELGMRPIQATIYPSHPRLENYLEPSWYSFEQRLEHQLGQPFTFTGYKYQRRYQ